MARAAEIFASNAKESLSSRLGAFSAKGYFFQALLCHLASGDAVQVGVKLDEFKNADFSFGSSRECGFVEKLWRVHARGVGGVHQDWYLERSLCPWTLDRIHWSLLGSEEAQAGSLQTSLG